MKRLKKALSIAAVILTFPLTYLAIRAYEMYPYLKGDVTSELERIATDGKAKNGVTTLEEHVKTVRDLLLYAYEKPLDSKSIYNLRIDKTANMMEIYNEQEELIKRMPVGTGQVLAAIKTRFGEYVTPNGNYVVINHFNQQDLTDKFGPNAHFYGSGLLQLSGPWAPHIAIHGTDDETKIGTYGSNGCVRVGNNDMLWLLTNVNKESGPTGTSKP